MRDLLSRCLQIASGLPRLRTYLAAGFRSFLSRRDIFDSQLAYVLGIASTYRPDPGGLVPVPDSSGGLLAHLVDLALKHGGGDAWLLVAEPREAGPILKDYVKREYGRQIEVTDLDTEMQTAWTAMTPELDLCDPDVDLPIARKVDVVITQALLEHVVDPVQAIRSMLSLLEPAGLLVIQTCNPFITLHRYPIDCLRFFPDFFENLQKYVPASCVSVNIVHGSIYAVLRKSLVNDV